MTHATLPSKCRFAHPPATSNDGPFRHRFLKVGSLWVSQVRGTGHADGATPWGDDSTDAASEWWRAGGGGESGRQQTLIALEVVKPLMPQDLERLSDQVRHRGGNSFHFEYDLNPLFLALAAIRRAGLGVPLVLRAFHPSACFRLGFVFVWNSSTQMGPKKL